MKKIALPLSLLNYIQILLIVCYYVVIGLNNPVLSAPPVNTLATAKAALTVVAVKPESKVLTQRVVANGTVFPWQEASVSVQVSGLRLTEIYASVGDYVKKGQLLARFDTSTINAEIAVAKAQVAEIKAASAESIANANRAKELAKQGFYSPQAVSQMVAQETAALARLDAAKANLMVRELRLNDSTLKAPDSGMITARNAVIGSVVNAGSELFKMNRLGRLEWRAEITSTELSGIVKGSSVLIYADKLQTLKVTGTVRQIAPNLDPQTRNGIVYVDIPSNSGFKVGQFIQGELNTTQKTALTLPINSIVLRDGFSYVFVINPNTYKVSQTKVLLGQRQDTSVEVIAGLSDKASVVGAGASFLADGDTVKVVQ